MRRHLVFAALLALDCALLACNNSGAPQSSGTLKPLPPPHGMPSPALPDPEQQGGHVGRAPRRITVAQLATSIEVTAGRPWSGLAAVAASLGRADYAMINAEGTETNLVFAKFLEEGAREVCKETALADLKQPKAVDRVLARELPDAIAGKIDGANDAAVRKNLGYLSLRFWGQPLAGEELDAWVTTWKAMAARAESTKTRDQALTAICVAFMTDARFITY